METTQVTPSCVLVSLGDISLLFSYRTLVGLKVNNQTYRTNKYYSRTTSKHITIAGFGNDIKVDPDMLEELFNIWRKQ